MKILTTVLLASALFVAGAGSAAAGHGNDGHEHDGPEGKMNVGQMKNMHSEMSVHEFKEMYYDHHGTLGAAPSKNFEHHMGNGNGHSNGEMDE